MWTWREYYNDIVSFAKSLVSLGIDERKAVNIMGFNAPEWAIAFYGSVFHNNVVSGVYITNGPAACQYQAHHSEAQVVVLDTEQQLRTYVGLLDQLPEVRCVVAWGVDKIPDDLAKDSRLHTFRSFMELGKKVQDNAIN